MEPDWKYIFFVAIFVGGVLSLFASSLPDGLEWVAERQGFLERGSSIFAAPFQDYCIPGFESETIVALFAGIFGVMFLFVFLFLLGKRLFSFAESK